MDQHRCVSSGQCSLALSAVFGQREDDGVAVPLDAEPPAALHDEVREATDTCPVRAIGLRPAPR